MKVLLINSTSKGSTGKIVGYISEYLLARNVNALSIFSTPSSDLNHSVQLSDQFGIKSSTVISRITGRYGFTNRSATNRLIDVIKSFKPDIIHLHNCHGHDFVFNEFIDFVNGEDIPLVITMHDEWLYTGYCPCPSKADCRKYMSKCEKCPERSKYSWFFDKSTKNQEDKIKALCSLRNVNLVTPSRWLYDDVDHSLIKQLPKLIINNGIDTERFKPMNTEWKKKLGIENKKIVMSAAMSIGNNKGLFYINKLAEDLSDEYRILLVGKTEPQEIKTSKIIPFGFTDNQQQLAELYSIADVFVNPTLFDNFPTVNIEALSCGTPVVTFASGGAAEMIDDTVGASVKTGDIDSLLMSTRYYADRKQKISEVCRRKAVSNYDRKTMCEKYLQLYDSLLDL